MSRWKDVQYPEHTGSGWALLEKGRVHHSSEDEIRSKVSNWQPQWPLLVALPGMAKFETPVSVPSLRDSALRSVRRSSRMMILGTGITAVVFLILAAVLSSKAIPYFGVFALTSLLFAIDYHKYQAKPEQAADRARFYYWMATASRQRLGLAVSFLVAALAGCSQLIAQQLTGGMGQTFELYGTMYESVADGEYWRLLTGAFLHYSVAHYLVNLVLLSMAGMFCWAVGGGLLAAIVFVTGTTLGTVAQISLGGAVHDNCGGLSFAIYALFGAAATHGFLNKSMPEGLPSLLMGIAIVAILTSEVMSATVATAGHFGGLAAGCGVVLLQVAFKAVVNRSTVTT